MSMDVGATTSTAGGGQIEQRSWGDVAPAKVDPAQGPNAPPAFNTQPTLAWADTFERIQGAGPAGATQPPQPETTEQFVDRMRSEVRGDAIKDAIPTSTFGMPIFEQARIFGEAFAAGLKANQEFDQRYQEALQTLSPRDAAQTVRDAMLNPESQAVPPQTVGAPPASHTVKPGDTLSAIGAAHGIDWKTLADYNGLTNPNLIHPGQEIKIPPGGTAPSAPTTPTAPTDPAASNGRMQTALEWSRLQMDPATATGVNSNNGLSVQQDAKAWNNWCLAFVSTAYGREIPEMRAGSAIESYNNFANAGKIVNSRDIPAGAPVFFNTTATNPYGHIAIATGRTTADGVPIVRTSGWDGRNGIFEMPLNQFGGGYLGYGLIS